MIKEKTITVLEVDWVALSNAVEQKVMTKLADDMNDWKDDRSMRAMFLCDAGDGLDVCEVLAKGVWQDVVDRLWKMDTAARDYLWDFIAQAGGELFVKHYLRG